MSDLNDEVYSKLAREADMRTITDAVLATNRDISDADLIKVTNWIIKAQINAALVQLIMHGRVSIGWGDDEPEFVCLWPNPELN